MRILQIAPLWERVPPPAYGGTEAVVHLLVEELVRMGHDVTLAASGDSQTSARLQACYPQSLRSAKHIQDKTTYSLEHAAFSLRHGATYDVIHNHAGHEVMTMARFVSQVPMLTTMHCLIPEDMRIIWDNYGGYYNAISAAQKAALPPSRCGEFAGIVYNGIDVASFPFQARKEDHLLFLSRIAPEKDPVTAIEVARRTGRRLVLAGKVDPADKDYFHAKVEPLIDGSQVIFVGEANAETKRGLYRRAAALILPLAWEEPFGLVLAESLACGTPVITFKRGAAPEIVDHEQTGYVVSNTDEMVESVARLGEIDPAACRRAMEARFDQSTMARNYLRTYQHVIDRHNGTTRELDFEQRRAVDSDTMRVA